MVNHWRSFVGSRTQAITSSCMKKKMFQQWLQVRIIFFYITQCCLLLQSISGLTEIIKGHKVKSLVILVNNNTVKPGKINEFIKELHKENIQSCIFYDKDKYFNHVQTSLEGSMETTSIIFSTPANILDEIQERNLAHRLALYIFYWGLKKLHVNTNWNLKEPLRVVIVTNPRSKV
jgi:hypothetical protein